MSAAQSDARLDQLLGQVSESNLMQYTAAIAKWERLSGSAEEREAFDYVEGLMRGFGLEVERFAPTCLVSLPVSATFRMVGSGDDFPAITHSFSTNTGPEGVEGELVFVGAGTVRDYEGIDARGKVALAVGPATPGTVGPAERHGAIAVVHISGPRIHEMIISPVWGSPTPGTVGMLPSLPHVSINAKTGDELRRRMEQGPVRVHLTTVVDTGWRPLPVMVAKLRPKDASDDFVLFSGHIDSWYYGAMDNGSANASMIEVARILAENQEGLRRGIWFGFWSGHSHARYATSAWFADEYWPELYDHCVIHVNIDSPGGIGATVLSNASSMAETYEFARDIIADRVDQDLYYRRIGRMGDQSFWGIGLPSLYNTLSEQEPSPDAPDVSSLLGASGPPSGGPGWWWHTADDTLDKIDGRLLRRDAQILFVSIYRLLTDRILPIDQSAAAREIQSAVEQLATQAPADLDLSQAVQEAAELVTATDRLKERASRATEEEALALNRCIMEVSRALVPVNYTVRGPFEQDPALGVVAVPGLRPITTLTTYSPDSAEYRLWLTKLRRERNRVRHALRTATRRIEQELDRTTATPST